MRKITRWTTEMLQQEAFKFKTRLDFSNGSPAYQTALARKLLDQICQHMIPYQKPYTHEELQKEALKYKNRTEFSKNSSRTYQVAYKRGILDQICQHMPRFNYSSGENHYEFKWTIEKIQEEALKFKTRSEFQKYNRKAYSAAHRLNILNQMCTHMKPSTGSSGPELELKAVIKDKYPTAKSIRDMSVKIPEKPYIQGFDIDIYIPELNRGIEFDGKYWHSFEKMKKSKSKKDWLDSDIQNYHQLKDAYFVSKGIQILHIKEEDWLVNKQDCIQRCFDFLTQHIV